MPVSVEYRFSPLRMILSKREPVHLDIFIKNSGDEEKKLTIKITLPPDIAFTKGGFKTAELIRVDSILPAEEKTLYFELHPRHNIKQGEKPINVTVQEHRENFRYAQKQYEKRLSLRVDE